MEREGRSGILLFDSLLSPVPKGGGGSPEFIGGNDGKPPLDPFWDEGNPVSNGGGGRPAPSGGGTDSDLGGGGNPPLEKGELGSGGGGKPELTGGIGGNPPWDPELLGVGKPVLNGGGAKLDPC